MAAKIHLRQSVNGTAACAIRGVRADGMIIRNSRVTYQRMGAIAVSPEDFRNVPDVNRCSHCCDRFTPMMNNRRKRAGKPIYANAFTKELA